MMSDLATISRTDLAAGPSGPWFVPTSLETALRLADLLYASRLVPDSYKSTEQVFAAIVMGAELGISPARACSAICVVKGKPSLYAEAMVGLVKASGACSWWRVVESTDATCTVETQRIGTPDPERSTWTIERAKRLGAGHGDQYSKQPGVMLRHRAESELARMVYPDVIGGLYTPDEVETMRAPSEAMPVAAAFAVPARVTTQPIAEHKQIEAKHGPVSPLILTPDAEPAKVETRAPEVEAPKANAADELTTMINRIGKLTHPFMPDEMKPAELRAAIRKFPVDDIADILMQCEVATRDPDEGDALLRALAGDILRGPADNE